MWLCFKVLLVFCLFVYTANCYGPRTSSVHNNNSTTFTRNNNNNNQNGGQVKKANDLLATTSGDGKTGSLEAHQHSPEFHRNHPNMNGPPFNHHHHQNPHRHHQGSSGEDFEDSSEENDDMGDENLTGAHKAREQLPIPVTFIQNLKSFTVNDLLLNYVEGGEQDFQDDGPIVFESRFGEAQERNGAPAVIAKDAICMPELTTVKLATSMDSSVLYIPQCTRIERCGGCCSHNLLSCQPQEIETVNYKVFKTKYTGQSKLLYAGKEVVSVDRHIKCKCECRIKKEDCTRYQTYKPSDCRCACTNFDEERKCEKLNRTKLWDPDLCACQCRQTMACSTGTVFSQSLCKCIPQPMRRRFAFFDANSTEFDDDNLENSEE